MVAKNIRIKETNETVKEKLLNSIKENNAVEDPGLNIDDVTDTGEAIIIIIIINSYEEIIKIEN